MTRDVISTTALVGDGRHEPDDIELQSVILSLNIDETPNTSAVSLDSLLMLTEDTLREYTEIHPPDSKPEGKHDALIEVTLPLDYIRDHVGSPSGTPDISIDCIQTASTFCPDCGADLRETYDEMGCTNCGFHPSSEHLAGDIAPETPDNKEEYWF